MNQGLQQEDPLAIVFSRGTGLGCYRFGKIPFHERQAREATCRKCGKKGHFQTVCRTGTDQEDSYQESDEVFLGMIGGDTVSSWTVEVMIEGKSHRYRTGSNGYFRESSQTTRANFLTTLRPNS